MFLALPLSGVSHTSLTARASEHLTVLILFLPLR